MEEEKGSEATIGFYYPSRLEVHVGPMKSGKSEAVIDRLRKLDNIAGMPYRYKLFKPRRDFELGGHNVVSRSHESITLPSIIIDDDNPYQILDYIAKDTHLVGIEEIHFFDKSLVEVVDRLLYDFNKNVIFSRA